jgi:DNA-directed RNA polymerase specialized sigma24 family protein
MSAHPPAHVSDPEGLAIHRLLLERDPGAFEALFYRYFEALKRRAFEKLYNKTDREDLANDLVTNALIKLCDEPERYQPEKGKSLWG